MNLTPITALETTTGLQSSSQQEDIRSPSQRKDILRGEFKDLAFLRRVEDWKIYPLSWKMSPKQHMNGKIWIKCPLLHFYS